MATHRGDASSSSVTRRAPLRPCEALRARHGASRSERLGQALRAVEPRAHYRADRVDTALVVTFADIRTFFDANRLRRTAGASAVVRASHLRRGVRMRSEPVVITHRAIPRSPVTGEDHRLALNRHTDLHLIVSGDQAQRVLYRRRRRNAAARPLPSRTIVVGSGTGCASRRTLPPQKPVVNVFEPTRAGNASAVSG